MRWLAITTFVLGCAHTPTRPCTVVTPELTLAPLGDERISKDDFITLHRDGCWGPCPIYSVTVYGDGRVNAQGEKFVAHTGALSWQIDPSLAERLLVELVRNNASSLAPKNMTDDMPTARLEGNIGGHTIAVKHFGELGSGDRDGQIATRLELLIEVVSEAEARVVGCVAKESTLAGHRVPSSS